MSIRSITDLAVKRDTTPTGEMVASDDPMRDRERTQDALISMLPSEVLVLYTALTGGTLAFLIQENPSSHLPYRWFLLAAAVVPTPVLVHVSYHRKYEAEKAKNRSGTVLRSKARVPYAEMATATIAATAWFLSAPGSPLLAILSKDIGTMASGAILTMAATVLLAGFGRQVRTGTA